MREPRRTFFRFVCRRFAFLRDGLLMMNVPLPRYSALYSLSFATVSVANLIFSVMKFYCSLSARTGQAVSHNLIRRCGHGTMKKMESRGHGPVRFAGRVLLLLACVLIVGAWQTPPGALEISSILSELSEITGFPVRHQLPFVLITRDEVNSWLKREISRSARPNDIRGEEAVLKLFGFVPDDFDLRQTTLDLLTEQAAAFYDYKRHKLFISDWAAANMRDSAIVHELAHALADQNVSLRKFTRATAKDSEMSLAREAVVEGQASWLMLEVEARRSGRSLADPGIAGAVLADSTGAADGQFPVFGRAPLYLRRTLLFPYSEGGRFQQAVYARVGKAAFARVFDHPPVSSAQVTHPERYFSNAKVRTVELRKPLAGMKALVTGSLGELETHVLLEQFNDRAIADDLAPRLEASSYRVDENRKTHAFSLAYTSDWVDDDAAARYFACYQEILKRKSRDTVISQRDTSRFTGSNARGHFRVVLKGRQVLAEEGLPKPPV